MCTAPLRPHNYHYNSIQLGWGVTNDLLTLLIEKVVGLVHWFLIDFHLVRGGVSFNMQTNLYRTGVNE